MDSSPTDTGQHPPTLPAKQRRSLYSRSSSTSSVDLNSRRSSTAFVSPLSSPSMACTSFSLPSSPHTPCTSSSTMASTSFSLPSTSSSLSSTSSYLPSSLPSTSSSLPSSLPPSSSCECFAPQCPIHHRYAPSASHQERYYSEKTPPPVPKKRLARTLSLPGEFPSSSSTRPALLPRFSNPLCTLSPLEDVVFDPGSGGGGGAAGMQASRASQPSPLPLPQLHFDTPDEQLPHFFSSLGDRTQVSESILQRLLLFLRSAAERMEEGVRRGEEAVQIQPQDLVLCRGDPTLVTQDGVPHHRVRCASLQQREFSIQVRRDSPTPIPSPQQPHPNVQQVIGHFPAGPEIIPNVDEKGGSLAPVWPQGGSSDVEMQQGGTADSDEKEPTVLTLLSQGYCVTISRDLTQGSLEEFVLRGGSPWGGRPEVYHRRLLLLLLQVTQALQHLKTHGVQVTDLDPRNILLAWRESGGGGREDLKRKEHGGSQKASEKPRLSNCDRQDGATERNAEEEQEEEGSAGGEEGSAGGEERSGEVEEGSAGGAEHLWRRCGTPRVVLTLCTSTTKSSRPITSHHTQLGLLLQRCLHLPEGTAGASTASANTANANTASTDSPYSQGLDCLLAQLLAPECGVQLADAVPVLQALLWGPRASLFQHGPCDAATVRNWLLVKRSLLLLKLAERGLFSDQLAVDWEDYLCLQYFSLTDPHTVLNATAKLGLHSTEL